MVAEFSATKRGALPASSPPHLRRPSPCTAC